MLVTILMLSRYHAGKVSVQPLNNDSEKIDHEYERAPCSSTVSVTRMPRDVFEDVGKE